MSSQTPTGSSAGAQSGHDPKILDAAALDRLRELDPDGRNRVLHRVLTAYESSLTRMCTVLEAQVAAAKPDPVVVSNIAHTLKSASASVGALALAAVCAEVEGRLRHRSEVVEAQDVEQLLSFSATTLGTVRAMLHA